MVVLAILIILASIFIPYMAKLRESDSRVRCANNLREIMQAMRSYASFKDKAGVASHDYPSVIYDQAHNPNGYTAFTGADSPDPFAKDTRVRSNDVTASLWLLVRYNLISPARFICPSTSNTAEPLTTKADQRSNFSDGTHLSYSYASPFSSAPGYKMNDSTHVADFALIADKNPGTKGKNNNIVGPVFGASALELSVANSNNHRKVGQNVLYADGHVQFQTTPYCGVGQDIRRDNIYTALSPIPLNPGQRPPGESNGFYGHDVGPAWTNDSFLVPTEEE
jgi:prepilin-type processing-associated H-X9-DG protein